MAKSTKKSPFNWSYIGLIVLLILIVFQFIQISNLESTKLKKEISNVESKLMQEQKQLKNNLKIIEENLNNVPKNNKVNSQFSLFWVVVFSIIITILIAIIVFLVFLTRENIKKGAIQSGLFIKNLISREENSNNTNSVSIPSNLTVNDIENTITKLLENEYFINTIVNKVQRVVTFDDEVKSANEEIIKKQNIQYLKGKSGSTFSNTSDTPDGSFFKLLNEKDGIAEFEYCGTIDDARSQFNAIFDNTSNTEGSVQNSKNIKTLKRGKIKFTDGKWNVTEKTKIKFE